MKKFSTLLLVAALVGGLSAGCKKKEEAPPAQEQKQELPAAEQQDAPDAANEEAADEDTEESDQEEGSEDGEGEDVVDEAMFIKAAYEVSCVKAKVDNPEEQKEILEVIYPRYGFETVEEYQGAETSFKDSASVKAALDEKMKNCTVEVARGFKVAGADEQPAAAEGDKADEKGDEKAEEKKPAAPKAPYKDGAFTGPYAGTGLKSGRINCSAYRGTLKCSVSGAAEGKGFSIPASGKIDKNGGFDVSGSAGKNKVSLKGQLKGSKAIGSAKLSVFQRDYTANFSF